jgi:DNA-binding NarL/FixJ family response regulator
VSTLLLCDDHRVVREALAAMLVTGLGPLTVSQAGTGEEVLARYPVEKPSGVLLDVRLPGLDGVEVTVRLLRQYPQARVLLLSGESREEDRARALRAGAVGFLAKDIDAHGLCAAVGRLVAGEDLLTKAQRRALTTAPPASGRPALSPRELQVLEGMAAGRSNAEIGRTLWVSEDTVKVHAKKLFVKTGVHDRAAAVAWAFRSGVLC